MLIYKFSQLTFLEHFRHTGSRPVFVQPELTLSFGLCLPISLTGFVYRPESCHIGLVNLIPSLISDKSLSHNIIARKNRRQKTAVHLQNRYRDSRLGRKILFIDDDNASTLDIPYVLLSNSSHMIIGHHLYTSIRQSTTT